jgi:hypothetical protein
MNSPTTVETFCGVITRMPVLGWAIPPRFEGARLTEAWNVSGAWKLTPPPVPLVLVDPDVDCGNVSCSRQS